VRHTDWDELEAPVRLAIEARTGRVHAARTASAGLNSQLAVVLDTDAGTVFVKGLRVDHPGVVRQGREAMINPFVRSVAPRLLWHDQAAAWDVLPSSTSTASGTQTTGRALRTCRVSSTPCTGWPRSAARTCR
jgi:hypothetical protein